MKINMLAFLKTHFLFQFYAKVFYRHIHAFL
jgi:hypothetical protein